MKIELKIKKIIIIITFLLMIIPLLSACGEEKLSKEEYTIYEMAVEILEYEHSNIQSWKHYNNGIYYGKYHGYDDPRECWDSMNFYGVLKYNGEGKSRNFVVFNFMNSFICYLDMETSKHSNLYSSLDELIVAYSGNPSEFYDATNEMNINVNKINRAIKNYIELRGWNV